jgi:pimeloyl-ACP methyl ester carboxylesterase
MPPRASSSNLRAARLGAATLLAAALLAATGLTPAAGATVPFSPCLNAPGFDCASLRVPLDRSGSVPGAVTLSIERLRAGAAPSEDALVALAGGPGQSAIPLAAATAHIVAPALGARDLVVFDQRGTGASEPLSCPVLEGSLPPANATVGGVFERCALQIGAARGSYTTQESVADIEAIRQALGYRRLLLFGVSYGTKVALEYAERYPAQVEALLLDSVVPTGHPDPFSLSTFKAMAPALDELCSARACAGITADPVGDLARLAGRLQRRSLRGQVYDGRGRRHRASLSGSDLLGLVAAGDLNPALRALLPAAVQSALRGDPAPLLRLNLLSEGLIPNVPSSTAASGGIDEALFLDTTCEEALFPWQRSAPPATRLAEALGALHALPGSDFYPFSAAVEWESSLLPGCVQWPNVAPAPPPAGPLPAVPTLLLSGAQDVRTPTSNAQLIAERIPGAQLLVVPYTGHSVLGSDFSGCAQAGVRAFFAGGAVQPCRARSDLFGPTPIAPTRLGYVKPVGGVPGKAGSTLAVALETIIDLERQVIGATLQAEQALPSGSSFGGLHGGYARLTSSALTLHRLSFVTGVQLSGTFPISKGRLVRSTLRVEGRSAARGTIRIAGNPHATGTLGGRHFDVNLTHVRLASAGARGAGAQQTSPPGTLPLSLRLPEPALARLR